MKALEGSCALATALAEDACLLNLSPNLSILSSICCILDRASADSVLLLLASAGAAATGATLASAGGAWAGDIATAAAGACAMDGATGVRTGLSTGAEDRGETSTIGTSAAVVADGTSLASMGAAVTSPLAACGARAACEAMGGSTIDGAAAGDCATDSTDSTAAGEAATSMTLRTLSASLTLFNRWSILPRKLCMCSTLGSPNFFAN
mmetsp:Transcript_44722/g.97167  ORF Transcript_44722/g.97167 Transcript_44722/m.97167 type:complete len:208 (-) Transcript_44722:248-871(-)